MSTSPSRDRSGHAGALARAARAETVTLVALLGFVLLVVAAALAYPGGSWADAEAPGFDPLRNYWCDLMRTVSLDGSPNETSLALGRAGFATLAVALLAFFRARALEQVTRGGARLVLVAGSACAALVAVLAVLPYDTRRLSHTVTTLSAGGLGFLATARVLARDLRRDRLASPWNVLGLGLVLALAANLGLYVRVVATDSPGDSALPVVQKVGTALFVGWVLSIAAWRRPVASDREGPA